MARQWIFVFATLMLFASGCMHKPASPNLDEAMAVDAMTEFLDAWKAGDRAGALLKGLPAVDVVDPDWDQGSQLKSYEWLLKDDEGKNWEFRVKLGLTLFSGKDKSQEVQYVVSPGTPIKIRRK